MKKKIKILAMFTMVIALSGCSNKKTDQKNISSENRDVKTIETQESKSKKTVTNLTECSGAERVSDIFDGKQVCKIFDDVNTILYSENGKYYLADFSWKDGIKENTQELFLGFSLDYYCKDKKIYVVDVRQNEIVVFAYDTEEKIMNEYKNKKSEEEGYLCFDVENEMLSLYENDKQEIREYKLGDENPNNTIKIKVDRLFDMLRAEKGKMGYAFYGGYEVEIGSQTKGCYGFVDLDGNIVDKEIMEISYSEYKDGIGVYEFNLDWTGRNTVTMLDANAFKKKDVKIETDEEAKNDISIMNSGKYMITDVSDAENNYYGYFVYRTKDSKKIGKIEFKNREDTLTYKRIPFSVDDKYMLFMCSSENGEYEYYKYEFKK